MTPRKVGAGDRLGVTLLFSVIAHGVLALGLTFEYEKSRPSLPSLDVILVQSASGEKPNKADFLAQANNSGGGESEKAVRPSELVSSPISKNESGVAPRPMLASAPKPQPPTQRELLTQEKSKFSLQTEHEAPGTTAAAATDRARRAGKETGNGETRGRDSAGIAGVCEAPEEKIHFRQHEGIPVRRVHVGVGGPRGAHRQLELSGRGSPRAVARRTGSYGRIA